MDIEAALASVDERLVSAREELDALVRIPSISARPEHADARAGERARRPRSCCARTASKAYALAEGRGLAPVRDRRVDARGPRRADRAAVRASRRAAAGHRRELAIAIPSSPSNATAGSTAAASPTTRRARSRTRAAGHGLARHQRIAPVQRQRADRGRGGDRLADAARVPHRARRRAAQRRARARRRRELGRSACPRITVFAARARRRPTSSCARSTVRSTRAWRAARCPIPVMALARVLTSLVDEHGDVAIDGVLGRRDPGRRRRNGPTRRVRRATRAVRARDEDAAGRADRRRPRTFRTSRSSGCGRRSP